MSAWICSATHIAAMVGSIRRYDRYGSLTADAETAQMLANENVRSVNFRYNENNTFPPTNWSQLINRFLFRPLDPVTLLKQIDCYEYQACECDDWEQTEAYKWCQKARRIAIAALPGYDNAPWGLHDTF